MTVHELKDRLTTFDSALRAHQQLWLQSLDQHLPDFPVENHETLKQQMRDLARQLGALRRYIDRFSESTVMALPALCQEWDVFDSAVGDDVAQRKGHSLEGALHQVQLILGQLDMLDDSEPVPGDSLAAHAPADRAKEPVRIESKPALGEEMGEKTKRVWVVHGRDERLRKGIFDFLYSIGIKPLEFSKARELTGKPMPYVKEILDAAFVHAQAVVVLLTPDDEARLRPDLLKSTDERYERELTGQARPNVIFEAGMAAVSHHDRTIMVKFGDVRPFTDIAGLHIVEMDGSVGKRQELAERLKSAGCPVELSSTHWHTAGDLTPLQTVPRSGPDLTKSAMEFREPYYYREGDETPFCPRCWEVNGTAVHLSPRDRRVGGIMRECRNCKQEYWEEQAKRQGQIKPYIP